jgi:CubicO group peptidase (beta-lactamase class C family)
MNRFIRWSLRILVVLVALTAVVAVWKWEDIQRLRAVLSLFDEDRIVANFSGMDRLFLHTEIPLDGAAASPLPRHDISAEDLPSIPDLQAWVERRSLTALVVLKDGGIVHEDYFLGTAATDRRISWSVAKSFLSALFGILVEEGHIPDLDDPVTRYAPDLAGSAYDGVSIRDVLRMSSGVRFDENYFDFHSDINRMGRVLALGGSMDRFAAGVDERDRPPGTAWQYVSIDTHVLGMVIRGATGRSVIELMGERLLAPLGIETRAYYVTDGHGVAFVLGGLNMATRDYARFGQLFLQDGEWEGRALVPADWVRESTAPSARTAAGAIQYGYQWWVPADARDGEFFARGLYGQYVYVDREAGVVVAMNSADRRFGEPGAHAENLAMFRRIARGLAGDAAGDVTADAPADAA